MQVPPGHRAIVAFACPTAPSKPWLLLRTFPRRFLREHVIQVHERLRRFRCTICGASYLQRAHANKHVAATHGEAFAASDPSAAVIKLSDAEARSARDAGRDTEGLRRRATRTGPAPSACKPSYNAAASRVWYISTF